MTLTYPAQQRGVVLIMTLVMLLALTLLAVNSMHGVTLETRVTHAHANHTHLTYLLDAALREGEVRLYGSQHLRDKLEADVARNCIKANTLDLDGAHRPCLLAELDSAQLQAFFRDPLQFFQRNTAYTQLYAARSGKATDNAGAQNSVAWMPYRGLDPQPAHYVVAQQDQQAYWNTYLLTIQRSQQVDNPEYGAALEGRGTFYYLVTAQANDRIAAQSTVAVVQLGLNE